MPPIQKLWPISATGSNQMLTPGEIAIIQADITRLERARRDCRDSGIRELIDSWIEEQKKKLISEGKPDKSPD
jgi:hypothetical protein